MEKGYGMNHRWEAGWSLRDRGRDFEILGLGNWEMADCKWQIADFCGWA
jgi:hypothetical protein